MDSTTSAAWRLPAEPVLTRLLAAAVVVFFCIPLFFGLGRADLENDEPIYSYAVEQMLRNGRLDDAAVHPERRAVPRKAALEVLAYRGRDSGRCTS